MRDQQFETFLVKKEIRAEDLITVLSKNTSNNSLLEIKDANSLIAGFEVLRKEFDMIIIDVESLQELNKAKEWLMFTDKSIGIISSGSVTDDQDHIRYLNQLDGFMGWVLNKVQVT